MGRPRTRDKHLPQRVYRRRGSYYFVAADGRWHPLGATEAEMYRRLAELLGDRPPERTLADLIRRYRTEIMPGKAAETRRAQEAQIERLEAVFGKMRPAALRPSHVAEWHDRRGRIAPVAANRELALWRHVLQCGVRWGVLDRNPAREVARHREAPRDRYVTDAEFEAVHALAGPREQLMMDLALITGRREGELLAMKRSQISDAGIDVAPAKRGRRLLIQWSDALREVIARATSMHPVASMYLVADSNGQRIPIETFRTAWGRLMTRALAEGAISERFTFHDLRAKAGTDGASGEHLGHTSASVLERVYRRKPKPVQPTR